MTFILVVFTAFGISGGVGSAQIHFDSWGACEHARASITSEFKEVTRSNASGYPARIVAVCLRNEKEKTE